MTRPLGPKSLEKLRGVVRPLTAAGEGPASELLGKYRILREIARGAMGIVYEAEDAELRRRVAVKVLQEIPGAGDVIRQRFHREAQAAAGLSHPNVLRVFDAGEDQGRLYLVMELIDGESLRDVLGRRSGELRPLLQLLEKAARGVAAAHEAGIVHRDLKPANILVTPDGEPKVGDFGLAHWMDSDSSLTKTGTPLGTPLYMAPEQVLGGGDRITPATDVYGLGAILYEMLTGRPPHTGDNTAEIYAKILREEPLAPRKFGTRVGAELETICLKSLEQDPARRYRNAKDFADDLRRHLDGESIVARPPGRLVRGFKWARRHRAVSASVAAVLLAAGSFAAFRVVERNRAIGVHLRAGRAAKADIAGLEAGLRRSEEEARVLARSVPPTAPDEERKPLWALQRGIEEDRRRLAARRGDLIQSFLSATVVDPGQPEARRELAAAYAGEWRRAREADDAGRMEECLRYLEVYDDGEHAALRSGVGLLSLDSRPPGAEADLLTCVEGEDRRLVPGSPRKLGRCPVAPQSLPAGSYLVILRLDGHRETRLPVRLDRGARLDLSARLHRDEEIGPDHVYVPGGPFIRGGDRDARVSLPREEVEVGDFFIGRFEVRSGDYLRFVNAVLRSSGPEEAGRRLPEGGDPLLVWRRGPGGYVLPADWPGDLAIFGVSWEDATAYAAWLTAEARARGEPALYRLPTMAEWEKAARGVDGRPFPWGRHFSWTFTDGGLSQPAGLQPELDPVGTFDRDESVYGVRDLAGGVMEWCSDWHDADRRVFRELRGGYFGFVHETAFRAASRLGGHPEVKQGTCGFRVVKVLER